VANISSYDVSWPLPIHQHKGIYFYGVSIYDAASAMPSDGIMARMMASRNDQELNKGSK
jgi:hypothetical protein